GEPRKGRVDGGGVLRLRDNDPRRAGAERRDRVYEKAVLGVERLVAIGEMGGREEVEQIVGARAADDAVRIEPEGASDRFAQRSCRAVRIVLKAIARRAIGGDRPRARPERRLVRRQLEY